MGAQLTAGGVVGDHLTREPRWDPHALRRQEQIEGPRLEDQTIAGLGGDLLPVVRGLVRPDLGEIEQARVPLRLVADDTVAVAGQVEPEEEAVRPTERLGWNRGAVVVEQSLLSMDCGQLVITHGRSAAGQPELV